MKKYIFICVSIISSILSTATVQAKPSNEDYAARPAVSMVRISPSGKYLAFLKRKNDEPLFVIYSISDKKVIHSILAQDLTPQDMYFIDDNHLVFVAARMRRLLGVRGDVNLGTAFSVNIASGKFHQLLTPGKGIYIAQSGLGHIAGLTKDKRFALMPAYVGKTTKLVSSYYSLMKTSINRARTPKTVYKGSPNTIDYFTGKNGQLLVEEKFYEQDDLHKIYSFANGEKTKIYQASTDIRKIIPVGLTPDEKYLLVNSVDSESKRDVLYKMSLLDGKISGPVFSRKDADVERVLFDGVYRIVRGVEYSGFSADYEFYDKKLDKRVKNIVDKFPGSVVSIADNSQNFEQLVVKVSGGDSSGSYYLVDKNNKITFLTNQREKISVQDVHPVSAFNFKARDGLIIPTLITVPNNRVDSLYDLPAVMLPHGGPESYDRMQFDWLAQAIANQGYLVIQPQFRGSAGFGAEHVVAGYGEWGKKMQTDLVDATRILAKEKLIDPKRVCIVGWSYGGYAALAGVTLTPGVYQCAVSINGVSDLPTMLSNEGHKHGREDWVYSYWRRQLTGDSQKDEDELEAVSPAYLAEKVDVPVLLFHGEKDKTVDIEQSELMRDALKEKGKNVNLTVFPSENHQLGSPEVRLLVIDKVISFLNKNLKNN